MANEDNAQGGVPVPENPPVLDIPMDTMRSREDVRTPAEWLVLFRWAQPSIYNGVPHPSRLETWIDQKERLLEASRIPRNLWVSFAVIQLEGEASRWWRNLQADSHTTSWSSFIGVL